MSWKTTWRIVAVLLSCLFLFSNIQPQPTTTVARRSAPPAAAPPLDEELWLAPGLEMSVAIGDAAVAAQAEEAAAAATSARSAVPVLHPPPPPPPASVVPARSSAERAPRRRAARGSDTADAAPSADVLHVALAADAHHFQALPGAILSAAAHASLPLVFHVLVPAEQTAAAVQALSCFGVQTSTAGTGKEEPGGSGGSGGSAGGGVPGASQPVVHVVPFRAALGAPVRVVAKAEVTGNLAAPLNFARFELPRLLPNLDRLLYLDADAVQPVANLLLLVHRQSARLATPRLSSLLLARLSWLGT